MKVRLMSLLIVSFAAINLGGCTAISLVDAAASTAVGAGKLVVKGTTAAVGAAIPDGEDEDKKKKK